MKYGFRFWFLWIIWFVAAFLIAAGGWTLGLQKIFGELEGPELTLTWAVAVFGSWFLLIIPFMRKKEEIWKRLNRDESAAADAWFEAMAIFIAAFLVSAVFWSWHYREGIADPHLDLSWAKAVFATWLILLVPFLLFMYRKADTLFRTAADRQGPRRFRSIWVEKEKRILPPEIAETVRRMPETLNGGHLVTLSFRDGRRVPNVFVYKGNEVLGVYDRPQMDFIAKDAVGAEAMAQNDIHSFDESRWTRLDGKR